MKIESSRGGATNKIANFQSKILATRKTYNIWVSNQSYTKGLLSSTLQQKIISLITEKKVSSMSIQWWIFITLWRTRSDQPAARTTLTRIKTWSTRPSSEASRRTGVRVSGLKCRRIRCRRTLSFCVKKKKWTGKVSNLPWVWDARLLVPLIARRRASSRPVSNCAATKIKRQWVWQHSIETRMWRMKNVCILIETGRK